MRALTLITAWEAALEGELAARERDGLLRELTPIGAPGPVVTRNGRRLLNLASNDYLGLSSHPALEEAAVRAARDGAGATASRLVVGTHARYPELEARLAEFQEAEAALVFGSGYLANVGVVSALVGRGDAVFSDELNHASIVDGCRLSGARVHVYRHLDADHLEALLTAEPAGKKLIVTDTVFSMDGDVAPLADLVELRERYDAALVVDEAHAGGVLGPRGEGLAHELGLHEQVDLHLGTLSKAFGAYGAYVAGGETWIRYLVNACRSLIYTTALPPLSVAVATAALELVQEADDRRALVLGKATRFRDRLERAGIDTRGSALQIVPAVAGETRPALEAARWLEEAGILAVAIRPPSVPRGSARIRFSPMATHDDHDLDSAAEAAVSALAPQ